MSPVVNNLFALLYLLPFSTLHFIEEFIKLRRSEALVEQDHGCLECLGSDSKSYPLLIGNQNSLVDLMSHVNVTHIERLKLNL